MTAAPSQPYYLDVTHPQANKGCVAEYLAQRQQTPSLSFRDHLRAVGGAIEE